jgi:hypothetical protein
MNIYDSDYIYDEIKLNHPFSIKILDENYKLLIRPKAQKPCISTKGQRPCISTKVETHADELVILESVTDV